MSSLATIIALLIACGAIVRILVANRTVEPLPPGCARPSFEVGVYYLPLIAWPPLLHPVTYYYCRRRVTR